MDCQTIMAKGFACVANIFTVILRSLVPQVSSRLVVMVGFAISDLLSEIHTKVMQTSIYNGLSTLEVTDPKHIVDILSYSFLQKNCTNFSQC